MTAISYTDITEAHRRIRGYVHRTPVMTSSFVDQAVAGEVFFKCENFQKVGAFKARGATNAVLSLTEDEASKGVVTHSSGNHGQAVAYACGIRGVQATVVVPEGASSVKVDAMRGYGAEVVFAPQPRREERVAELVSSHGFTVIHPFNDERVIAGQGTAALELFEDVDDLDIVVTPVGGGGLASGTAVVARALDASPVGVEPEVVDDAYRSLRDGVLHPATGNRSVGDGLLTGLGTLTFDILRNAGTEIVLVSEAEILEAMAVLATRMKLVVEPSGATVLAGMLRHRSRFEGKRVGAVLSGGNVDLSVFAGISS
jgi:threonine dehydratase